MCMQSKYRTLHAERLFKLTVDGTSKQNGKEAKRAGNFTLHWRKF